MKLNELCEKYKFSVDEITFYYNNNIILKNTKFSSQKIDYLDEEITDDDKKIICHILLLREAGLSKEDIVKYFEYEDKDYSEQVRILRKLRCNLLTIIHDKQKLLDKIDYIIYEKTNRGENNG